MGIHPNHFNLKTIYDFTYIFKYFEPKVRKL